MEYWMERLWKGQMCHTNQMTAADAYHCCIVDIMNIATCLRLDSPDLKGLNRLTLERGGRRLPDGIPTILSNYVCNSAIPTK
eukprot:scaffold6849_cov70-Cyclotella_meneghiniana.AAC.2